MHPGKPYQPGSDELESSFQECYVALVVALLSIAKRTPVVVESVGGDRGFRRRLQEMGLLPGTTVAVISIAPFGDPIQIEVRGTRWSIRREEAAQIAVRVP